MRKFFSRRNKKETAPPPSGIKGGDYYEEKAKEWLAMGVTRAIWQTVNDQHVCPVCQELSGKTFDLITGAYSTTLQRYVKIPCCEGCRCFMSADMTSMDYSKIDLDSINMNPPSPFTDQSYTVDTSLE